MATVSKDRGIFISVEGGEGAGKSTQVRLLAGFLTRSRLSVVQTREPGGAPGAEALRALLLGGKFDWSIPAETLLHFAARAEHVEKTIRPALKTGQWVISDRYFDSTMAYQGYGQGADRSWIAALSAAMLQPTLTIVLDIPDSVGFSRVRRRGQEIDRYERLPPDFHARVNQGFREIARQAPARCVLVSAAGPEEEVHRAVVVAVRAKFPRLDQLPCDSLSAPRGRRG
jgi:dTMP kinase